MPCLWVAIAHSTKSYLIAFCGIRFRQVAIGIVALAVWVFLFVVGIVWLKYNVNANALCPGCRYISCVPSPWWTCSDLPPATGSCIPAVVLSGNSSLR